MFRKLYFKRATSVFKFLQTNVWGACMDIKDMGWWWKIKLDQAEFIDAGSVST